MAILKFKDAGEWKSIAAFKGEDGKDGAIQYTAGAGINISPDNVISATMTGEGGADIIVDATPAPASTNAVSSGGVYTALQAKADRSEIKTDTSQLTNGAGFITSDDIPKDLGSFDNEVGYLKEESDPLFKKSPAYKVTEARLNIWDRVASYTFVPISLALNFNESTVVNFNYTYSDASIYNKILEIAGSMSKAIVCIVTNAKSVILHYDGDAYTNSEVIFTYWGETNTDDYGHRIAVRLKITLNRSTGAHKSTVLSTLGSGYGNVTKGDVLTKTNTTAFTPTASYHPATKLYVDQAVAEGVAGVGGGIEQEEDPLFMNSAAASITEEDVNAWRNYRPGIVEEADPTVPSWVKGITEADIKNWNDKADTSGIGDIVDEIVDGKGFITSEDDFNNSAAADIDENDILNWNNKQDKLLFETEYDAVDNKVATVADIPTRVSELTNDKDFIPRSEMTISLYGSDTGENGHINVYSNSSKAFRVYLQDALRLILSHYIQYENKWKLPQVDLKFDLTIYDYSANSTPNIPRRFKFLVTTDILLSGVLTKDGLGVTTNILNTTGSFEAHFYLDGYDSDWRAAPIRLTIMTRCSRSSTNNNNIYVNWADVRVTNDYDNIGSELMVTPYTIPEVHSSSYFNLPEDYNSYGLSWSLSLAAGAKGGITTINRPMWVPDGPLRLSQSQVRDLATYNSDIAKNFYYRLIAGVDKVYDLVYTLSIGKAIPLKLLSYSKQIYTSSANAGYCGLRLDYYDAYPKAGREVYHLCINIKYPEDIYKNSDEKVSIVEIEDEGWITV